MAIPQPPQRELTYTITSTERSQRESQRVRKVFVYTLPAILVSFVLIVLANGRAFMGTILVTAAVIAVLVIAIVKRPSPDVQVALTSDGVAVMRRGTRKFHPWSAFCSFTDIATFVENFGSSRNRQADIENAKFMQAAHGNVFKLFYTNPKWYSANVAYTLYAEPDNAAQVRQFLINFIPAYDPKNSVTLSVQQKKLQMYVAIISALFLALAVTIFAYLRLTQF
jgi:hypothetical protein